MFQRLIETQSIIVHPDYNVELTIGSRLGPKYLINIYSLFTLPCPVQKYPKQRRLTNLQTFIWCGVIILYVSASLGNIML